jgi:hypothetical protein
VQELVKRRREDAEGRLRQGSQTMNEKEMAHEDRTNLIPDGGTQKRSGPELIESPGRQ